MRLASIRPYVHQGPFPLNFRTCPPLGCLARISRVAPLRSNPIQLPDTNVALHAWGTPITASADVFSMGCGWTEEPWQPNPTMETMSKF